MSTLVELLPRVAESAETAVDTPVETGVTTEGQAWDGAIFAELQIKSLVQHLFLSSRKKRLRQIVFTGADRETDLASLCLRSGQTLCQQDCGTVCVVNAVAADSSADVLDIRAGANFQKKFGVLRDAAQQLSSRLWVMPGDLLRDSGDARSVVFSRGRLAELRLDFDYTILQTSNAFDGQAGLLGSICDGIVLVLRANATRRVTAQRALEVLKGANARVLGTVLIDRTFPIPEAIYRRL